jgi:hypothetical protein
MRKKWSPISLKESVDTKITTCPELQSVQSPRSENNLPKHRACIAATQPAVKNGKLCLRRSRMDLSIVFVFKLDCQILCGRELTVLNVRDLFSEFRSVSSLADQSHNNAAVFIGPVGLFGVLHIVLFETERVTGFQFIRLSYLSGQNLLLIVFHRVWQLNPL